MSRKMRVLLSALAALMVLSIGGAAAVLAQEDESALPGEGPASEAAENSAQMNRVLPLVQQFLARGEDEGVLSRVAGILGIPEEDLREAVAQARQEMAAERWEEAFSRAVARALEEDLITQEEADELLEWWAQKPDALEPGLFRQLFRFTHRPDQPGTDGRFGQRRGPPDVVDLPEPAREPARFGLEQAGRIREWLQARPDMGGSRGPQAGPSNAMRGLRPGGMDGFLSF